MSNFFWCFCGGREDCSGQGDGSVSALLPMGFDDTCGEREAAKEHGKSVDVCSQNR